MRGTSEQEVHRAIRHGVRESAKGDRWMYRYNVEFNDRWQGRPYHIKQVAQIVAEKDDGFIVITVYTFYF